MTLTLIVSLKQSQKSTVRLNFKVRVTVSFRVRIRVKVMLRVRARVRVSFRVKRVHGSQISGVLNCEWVCKYAAGSHISKPYQEINLVLLSRKPNPNHDRSTNATTNRNPKSKP
jgi:hypothetical protein